MTTDNDRDPFSDAEFPESVVARFDALRRADTIVHSERLGGWVITRHADVRALLLDPRLTANRTFTYTAPFANADRPLRADALLAVRQHMPMFADGDVHCLGRMPFRAASKPTRLSTEKLMTACSEILHPNGPGDEIDAIQQFAAPYAVRALTSFLGIDVREGTQLGRWADVVHAAFSPSRTIDQVEAADAAVREIAAWLDAVDALEGPINKVQALLRDGRIPADAGVAFAVSAVSAGAGTVQDALGNSLARIAEDACVRASAVPNVSYDTSVVDELLRLEGPVLATRREVVAPITVRGQRIRAGQCVVLAIASANRDPAAFAEAERFVPERTDRVRAIPFGFGAHRCAAAEFGRAAFSAGLRAFVQRFPKFVAVGRPEWRAGATMRGRERVVLRIG